MIIDAPRWKVEADRVTWHIARVRAALDFHHWEEARWAIQMARTDMCHEAVRIGAGLVHDKLEGMRLRAETGPGADG